MPIYEIAKVGMFDKSAPQKKKKKKCVYVFLPFALTNAINGFCLFNRDVFIM